MLNVTSDYRQAVYAPIREFRSKMIFTIDGVSSTFYDDKIMKFNITEEMNVINNVIPANELSITMNNEAGDFNMLNYQNMFEIIAGRPKIETFLGLVYAELDGQTLNTNYQGKVAGSLVANANIVKYVASNTLRPPSYFVSEAGGTLPYSSFSALDGNSGYYQNSTNGNMVQVLFQFDVIQLLERSLGTNIWNGKTLLSDKINLAKTYITNMVANCHCKGSSPTGNKASFSNWRADVNAWNTATTHTNSTITKLTQTIDKSLVQFRIDSNGMVNFLLNAEASNGTIATRLDLDFIELVVTVDPILSIEYIPMGVFYLYEWKSEVNNLIVTLTGRDNFDLLNDVSYENTVTDTYYNLAIDILTKAGITDYYVDDHLKDFSGNFNDRTDSRSALQNLGIASRSAVWQDRTGKIIIKPFQYLDESSNYLTYTGQPQVMAGTYWAQPIVSTGAGMKYIDFDQMYDSPQISLEKSISQIVVKIYIDQENPIEKTYTNTAIGGKGGSSFLLDNDLIDSIEVADDVAEWFIRETNYSAVYKANWRQNPILEAGDIVLIEDSFGAGKQTRITSQTFNYEGYLYGSTESRGGI